MTTEKPDELLSNERLTEIVGNDDNGNAARMMATELLFWREAHEARQQCARPAAEVDWNDLSCDDQFLLAKKIAANIGYALVEEPDHPDSPHAVPPVTASRNEVLEEAAKVAEGFSVYPEMATTDTPILLAADTGNSSFVQPPLVAAAIRALKSPEPQHE